jgi:hypothetical protein
MNISDTDLNKLKEAEVAFFDNIPIFELRQNAFVGIPVMCLGGWDIFRYTTARTLAGLDRLLYRLGIVKGFERIMIARKRG